MKDTDSRLKELERHNLHQRSWLLVLGCLVVLPWLVAADRVFNVKGEITAEELIIPAKAELPEIRVGELLGKLQSLENRRRKVVAKRWLGLETADVLEKSQFKWVRNVELRTPDYRAGDILLIQAVPLNVNTNLPPDQGSVIDVRVRIKVGKVEPMTQSSMAVFQGELTPDSSSAWLIAEVLEDGPLTIGLEWKNRNKEKVAAFCSGSMNVLLIGNKKIP
ncbi:MAG: hypothetical protein KDA84_15290 [Planctomycetaceae bacterium]|nr:hypothetical protein [Planctomycetaceae bacterium]